MNVHYTRTAPGPPTRYSGLVVDDSGAVAWQSAGARVGRFARVLTARERDDLETALDAARRAAPAAEEATYAGAVEQVVADGVDLAVDAHADLPAGSAELVALLRVLAEALADSPVAALELDVAGTPATATLRHVGTEPLPARIGTLTSRVTLFAADSAVLARAEVTVEAAVDGPIAPGWSLAVADALDVTTPAGGFVTVSVGPAEADVLGDGVLRPTELGWTRDG